MIGLLESAGKEVEWDEDTPGGCVLSGHLPVFSSLCFLSATGKLCCHRILTPGSQPHKWPRNTQSSDCELHSLNHELN